jgi:hypothetical protein
VNPCTAPKFVAFSLTCGFAAWLCGSIVLVDHAAEYFPAVHRLIKRQDDLRVVVGRPLLAGLVRAVTVVMVGRPPHVTPTRPPRTNRSELSRHPIHHSSGRELRLPQTVPDFPGRFSQAGGSPSACARLRRTDLVYLACRRSGARIPIAPL